MYQLFDDEDSHFESDRGLAGAPDPESSASLTLWMHGLLDDPLGDSPKSENEKEERDGRVGGIDSIDGE